MTEKACAPVTVAQAVLNARIDISHDIDGDRVVFACFDLDEQQLAGSAHAVAAVAAARFRVPPVSTDDVLELRELTVLADDLGEFALRPGIRTIVLRPARLSVLREALEQFVATHDAADWSREQDREPLARVRGLLLPIGELCSEALAAVLSPAPRPC
jgi:hypothetical protein